MQFALLEIEISKLLLVSSKNWIFNQESITGGALAYSSISVGFSFGLFVFWLRRHNLITDDNLVELVANFEPQIRFITRQIRYQFGDPFLVFDITRLELILLTT